MTNLILGDSYLILKTLAGDSVDAVVTDPPYGLSFMNKHWDHDVPSVELWREVLRVLKPGGHVLSFGGTRTYHRMVVNIEDAGFEIRDQIQWLYGSGFPKSMDVSKAIDKAAGAEREVVGEKTFADGSKARKTQNLGADVFSDPVSRASNLTVTAPATAAAKQWKGWGTALKPANEPIVLARKPLIGTVAENVKTFGTGALNIDASRIATDDNLNGGTYSGDRRPSARSSFGNGVGGGVLKNGIGKDFVQPQGRWPANVLFDEDAAAVLDAQSGISKSVQGKPRKSAKPGKGYGMTFTGAEYSDFGGASRFFFVVKGDPWQDQKDLEIVKLVANNSGCDEALLNTVLKAVRTNCKSDRQLLLSLDSIPDFKKCILIQDLASLAVEPESIGITEITQSLLRLFGSVHHAIDESINSENQNLNSVPTRFLYQPKASKRERGDGNHHPTVKPIKLMEYLVRLITPPGGTVLDPFMGSGTTGIAAKNLCFGFVGIERSEEYFEIAKRRI